LQPLETQPTQQLADRALVQLDHKLRHNPLLQVDTAPPPDTIPLTIRTLLDPFRHRRPLFG